VTSKGFHRAAIVIAVLLFGATSSAQPDDATPSAPPPPAAADAIEITVVGGGATLERVRGALASHSFAPATLRWLWSARWDPSELISRDVARSGAVVRCWVVLSDTSHAHLYFADRTATRFLLRDLDLSGTLDELDREALSQALELSIRALLEDQQAGMNREEARSLLAPRARPATLAAVSQPVARSASPEHQSAFTAGASWQIEGHSRELGLVQGPQLSLGYERALAGFRAALWASAQYQLKKTYLGPLVGLSLRTVALRSGLRLTWPLRSASWFAGALLGGGVDLAQFAPRPGLSDSSAMLTPERTRAIPTLCIGALVGTELGRHARLNVALLANVPLLSVHYDVELAGVRERVDEPWSVRPGLSIALEVH
jgi:hypothetical protein